MRGKITFLNISLFIVGFILIAGCDHTFEPLQENENYHFSIYGYLDATADTQWVRVGPARRAVNEPPDPSGIRVTLEHIQSGQTIVMNDSLFSDKNFLNYWTTHDIENEQTYRITAERDGKSSRVTVTMPKELPTPRVLKSRSIVPGEGNIVSVYIDDSIDHLADVQSKWYVLLQPDGQREKVTYSFSHRNTAKYTTAFYGAWFVDVLVDHELRTIQRQTAGSDIEIIHRQIFVAAGGPEWNENISSIDDLEYFLDGTASNVENGLGYVVGIDTKLVPMETCYPPGGELIIPCEPEESYW